MKTRLLIIIAVFLALIPWIRGLEFDMHNQVMVDGITVSSITVMALTITFSIVSWFLFSWASKHIKFIGIPLSTITGASLVIPFLQVLGPMAGIIVGIVAGFAAFMLQKKILSPAKNQSLIIATITIVATYFVLVMVILAAQSPHVWDTGNGIGEWTGTADGMEVKGFDNILGSDGSFAFFLVIIPSLIITGLIIRDKTTKTKLLIIIGIALMIEGLLPTIYTSFILFPPTEPPMMRPLEGIDYVLFMYRQAFLFSGIIGIFVTLAGVIPFWKERTGKRDMRNRK